MTVFFFWWRNSSGDFTLRARAEKKKLFFFSSTGVNDGDFFSGGWSPHMDYPGDSVMARASSLVELCWAKNGLCFRRFLTDIFIVK